MSAYRCATCEGKLEATRKTYLTLHDSGFGGAGLDDSLTVYCENDCFELVDLDAPADLEALRALLVRLVAEGYAEAVPA